MSDVLFDTGKHTLRPLVREKLAKNSGILLAYPALYLAQQGVPESSMTAKDLGKTQPIASNRTAEGRQQNRRVELIVSGGVIGTKIGSTTQSQVR